MLIHRLWSHGFVRICQYRYGGRGPIVFSSYIDTIITMYVVVDPGLRMNITIC